MQLRLERRANSFRSSSRHRMPLGAWHCPMGRRGLFGSRLAILPMSISCLKSPGPNNEALVKIWKIGCVPGPRGRQGAITLSNDQGRGYIFE